MSFSWDYPEATVVHLQWGYRSTPQATELANDVIGHAQGRITGSRLKLIGQCQDGPELTFSQYGDELMEARATVRSVKRPIDAGTPALEVAALYRIGAQSAVFKQALSEVGAAYQVCGGDGLYQRPKIRDAIAALVRASCSSWTVPTLQGANLLDSIEQVFAKLGMTDQGPEGAGARGC